MTRGDLKQLINEIVQRKLNEVSGQRVATVITNIVSNEAIKDVQILTHYGSNKLDIMEVYQDNGVLYLTVNANPLNEADVPPVGSGQQNSDQQPSNPLSDKTDSEKTVDVKKQKEIQDAQKKLDKITADVRKTDGMISKLQEPVRAKVQKLERQKASLQKQQGIATKKVEDLKADMQ